MIQNKSTAFIAVCCVCFGVAFLNGATIPAGTTLIVNTVSLISSQTVAGRSFEAKVAKDVSIRGNVVLKAGTTVFGKITSSRANPRKSCNQSRSNYRLVKRERLRVGSFSSELR
jgi:hypothetical protein